MKYYVNVLKKYAVFKGRASRKEYWMFVLFNVVISVIASILDVIFGTDSVSLKAGSDIGLINSVYSLAVFIPSLAVAARRLHDTNRSAKWMLAFLVPVVMIPFMKVNINVVYVIPVLFGIIMFIYLFFLTQDSTPGDNKYGPNPKEKVDL